jgi:nitric oxide reductase NorE protein
MRRSAMMTGTITFSGERSDEGGEWLLWVLVWSELAAFGMLLIGFLVMSVLHHQDFATAQLHLNTKLASVNTIILLSSGWLAAAAVRDGVTALYRKRALLIAGGLGFLFVVIKLMEYAGEIRFAGDATFNAFFELYFMITGFHLAHVAFLGGLLIVLALRKERSNDAIVTTIWHVIDLVWVVMFPLLYLV